MKKSSVLLTLVMVACFPLGLLQADELPARYLYAERASGMCTVVSGQAHVENANFDVHLEVYLFASGNYVAHYEETTPPCYGGQCSYDVQVEVWAEGSWSYSGTSLSLSGFGTAAVTEDSFVVTLSDSRVSSAAQGQALSLGVVGSSAVAYTVRMQMQNDGYTTTLPEIRDAVYP
ncbi:MAG: hypothetical protein RBU37_07390 [Myxococcota bacterium]|jgi:hypothetical protein|nr:hypothetical protein [Myxococcota bacterium]